MLYNPALIEAHNRRVQIRIRMGMPVVCDCHSADGSPRA